MIRFTPTSISVRLFGLWITYSGRAAPWHDFLLSTFWGYVSVFKILLRLLFKGIPRNQLQPALRLFMYETYKRDFAGTMSRVLWDEYPDSFSFRKRLCSIPAKKKM